MDSKKSYRNREVRCDGWSKNKRCAHLLFKVKDFSTYYLVEIKCYSCNKFTYIKLEKIFKTTGPEAVKSMEEVKDDDRT